jgi:putative oxidoreductase
MTFIQKAVALRNRAIALAQRLDWLPLLLVRASLAAVFVPSGWGKLHDLGKVSEFFTELGIPAPAFNATLVAISELGCGLLLLVGVLSRLAAIPLIISMTVATITAKRDEITGIAALLAIDEVIYVVMAIVILVLGAGRLSIDGLLGRRFKAFAERGGADDSRKSGTELHRGP